MNYPFSILCFLVLLLSPCSLSAHAEKGGKVWNIEVVPSRYSKNNGAVLYATKPIDKFYIVLHNVSGKEQRVWRDWCSWGYYNLSLRAQLEDGSQVMLTKAPKVWSKNYPDAALVPTGKSYVFEVHLNGKTWQGLEKLPKEPFDLSVIYQIKKSEESVGKKVWSGEATSSPLKVTVRK